MSETNLHSRASTVFDVTLVLCVFATVFVALRLISKWGIVKRNNSDDVFTIIAWVSNLILMRVCEASGERAAVDGMRMGRRTD